MSLADESVIRAALQTAGYAILVYFWSNERDGGPSASCQETPAHATHRAAWSDKPVTEAQSGLP
jgi:hypothetical protein